MDQAKIEQRINDFIDRPTAHINLSGLGIQEIPQTLIDYIQAERHNLETIDLSDNGMQVVPSNLEGLDYSGGEQWVLDFSHNNISDFSPLFDMSLSIKQVDVSHCPIGSNVDKLIGGWKKALFQGYIDNVVMSHCQLTTLPAELKNSELNYFNVSHNGLTEMPSIDINVRGRVRLNIAHNQLAALPEWIPTCEKLNVLDVRGNPLEVDLSIFDDSDKLRVVFIEESQIKGNIPKGFYSAEAQMWLTKFDFEGEHFWYPYVGFDAIPDFICDMPNLKEVNVAESPLVTKLPDAIGQVQNLTLLDISKTNISDLSGVSGLRNLTQIIANHTLVDEVPADVLQNNDLTNLEFNHTQLTELPLVKGASVEAQYSNITALPENFAELNANKVMNLTGNRLTTLPKDLGGVVERLYAGKNQITSVPDGLNGKNIRSISLHDNQLRSVPMSIFDLPSVSLGGNPFDGIPEHVSKAGGKKLLLALRDGVMPKSGAEIYAELFEQGQTKKYNGRVPDVDAGEPDNDERVGRFVTDFEGRATANEGHVPIYIYHAGGNTIYYAADTTTPQYTMYKTGWDCGQDWRYHSDSLEDFLRWFEEYTDYE